MKPPLSKPLDHGLLVAAGYKLFEVARWVSLTWLWSLLGKKIGSPCIFAKRLKKTTPVWQDIVAIMLLILTLLIAILSITDPDTAGGAILIILSLLILLDMLIYYVNVVWFDDLRPRKDFRVWSFRRIVLQAFLSFGESIVLFGVLYRVMAHSSKEFSCSFFFSFVTATTLNFDCNNLNKCFGGSAQIAKVLWSLQVLLSLFFLIIVIAVLAELGFTRKEIVGSTGKRNRG